MLLKLLDAAVDELICVVVTGTTAGASAGKERGAAITESPRANGGGLLMCSPEVPRLRIEEELDAELAYP